MASPVRDAKADAPTAGAPARPLVEVVVPVHNEQRTLEASIWRLHGYLSAHFPFAFRITVADNASTDATWPLARKLAEQLPRVRAVHLDQKGRGRALRHVWSGSDADVVAYMDVDLSTGLEALLPLVAPLLSGHSDLAIGSRLARGAAVVRGPRRELVSRCYNLLLRATLRARFSDAQCGFKAGRTEVVQALLPAVEDQAWFFDTELLLLAERGGLRTQASAMAANAGALLASAVANTAANRRWTFGVRGGRARLRHHLEGLAVFGLGLALTSGALWLLDLVAGDAGRAAEMAALLAANAAATLLRFILLRSWVFHPRRTRR